VGFFGRIVVIIERHSPPRAAIERRARHLARAHFSFASCSSPSSSSETAARACTRRAR